MKFFALFILAAIISAPTLGQPQFGFLGSAGFGGSSFGQGESHWSKSGNVSLGMEYSGWQIKYERRVNSEFTFDTPEYQSKSHELLLGHTCLPDPQITQLVL